MLTAISIEREAGSKVLVRVGDELPSCRSQWGWGVGHRHTCVRVTCSVQMAGALLGLLCPGLC